MKKRSIKIVYLLVVTLSAIGFVFHFLSCIRLDSPQFVKGTLVTKRGIVTENMRNVSAGQPLFLKVRTADGGFGGSEIKVIYQTGNTQCSTETLHIQTGERMEIHGVAVSEDTVSTCGSHDYYIKPITMSNSTQNSGNDKTQDTLFVLHFFAGGSITGNTFEVEILNTHITYNEFEPGNTTPVRHIERTLLPAEFEKIFTLVADTHFTDLQSQDFNKEPMIPDQGRYQASITYEERTHTMQCAISPPAGTEKRTLDCQIAMDTLRDTLNTILGVTIY